MKIGEAFPSKYLKASDIEELGEPVLTIKSVRMEEVGQGAEKDSKPLLMFKELEKGFIANLTNCKTITKVLGTDDTDEWIGKKIILKAMEVEFKGDMVMSIRVSLRKPAAPTPVKKAPAQEEEEAPIEEPF